MTEALVTEASGLARRAGHIVLVGLPGAGKTTVGRLLAQRLGRTFLDLDDEIVRRQQRSIPEIFASEGEAGFRRLEASLTDEVAGMAPAVVAPGGGWLMEPGMLERMPRGTLIAHLSATPATALGRMGKTVAGRPLLAGPDKLRSLEALWNDRKERYRLADVQVDTEMLAPEEVADVLIVLINRSGQSGRAGT